MRAAEALAAGGWAVTLTRDDNAQGDRVARLELEAVLPVDGGRVRAVACWGWTARGSRWAAEDLDGAGGLVAFTDPSGAVTHYPGTVALDTLAGGTSPAAGRSGRLG